MPNCKTIKYSFLCVLMLMNLGIHATHKVYVLHGYGSAKCMSNPELMQTGKDGYAKKLPYPSGAQIGIIAGKRGKTKGYNPFIQGDNDGLLTPVRTKP